MTVERYRPPLQVHVCWPAAAPPSAVTLRLADRVHCRLSSWIRRGSVRLDGEQASGAGIPVLLGTPVETVRRELERGDSVLSDAERTAQLVMGIFDETSYPEAKRDKQLEALVSDHDLGFAVALDDRWRARLPKTGRVLRADSALDALAGVMTRALGGPDTVRLFIDEQGPQRKLADALWQRITRRKLDTLFRRPEDDGVDQLRADPRATLFVHVRRDGLDERDACAEGHLVAKELRIPVVSAHCLATGEEREPAYAGNGPVVVVRKGKRADVDRLIDECLRAWLAHSYFKADAKRIRRAYALPLETVPLSRPPELVDFAQGTLPATSSVVLYPDPPLPVDEATLIQRQFPRARLLTPTTLHGQMLTRRARPPLDGMRIALSLSRSPELPNLHMADEPSWEGGRHPDGLTERHYEEATRYLTTCLIQAGAELAYGGRLDVAGHTGLLSSIVSQYRQLQREADDLLHVYVTDATKSAPTANEVQAAIHECAAALPTDTPADVKNALDYSAMRRRMAADCHARVILGGKTRPVERGDDGGVSPRSHGYSGRFPGQAEEARAMLRAEGGPKPLYVIGAFGGAAACIGRALAGETGALPGEAEATAVGGYHAFRERVDRVRGADGPADLDALWSDLRAAGWSSDEQSMWINGLTGAENRRLFESTQVREIAGLVMRGLMRVARQRAAGGAAQLTVMPYHGSITGCPPVEAYVVPVVAGLPMEGAGGAIDAAMNGRLRSERDELGDSKLAEPGVTAVVPTRGNGLAGDWVLLVSLGRRDGIPHDARAAVELQRVLGRRVGERALEVGWRELAMVPMGGNLGLAAGESLQAFLEGLRSVDGLQLESLVVCETDPSKYDEVASTCVALTRDHADITLRTVPADPVPPRASRSPIIMIVRDDDGELASLLIPPRASTSVRERRVNVDGALRAHLSRPKLDPVDPDALQSTLRGLFIGEDEERLLRQWAGHPVRVVHDEACAALPFELLLTVPSRSGAPAEHCFAREEGVTRELTTTGGAHERRTPSPTAGRLRILLVADPAGNLPLAREEAARLKTDLELRGVHVIGPILGEEATRDAVLGTLEADRVDVLQYSGHASARGLELRDGVLDAARASQLRVHPTVVVLNACQSGALEPTLAGDVALARELLKGGARCFVGTGWLIPDGMGARFGRRFLCEVADAVPIGAAFARTLRALRDEDFERRYWFYYRLFGDAGLVLR